jgi:hypothetical protein
MKSKPMWKAVQQSSWDNVSVLIVRDG